MVLREVWLGTSVQRTVRDVIFTELRPFRSTRENVIGVSMVVEDKFIFVIARGRFARRGEA